MDGLGQQLDVQLEEPQGRDGWELFFARWRETGRTLSAVCRERGICYHKARYWKKRLGISKSPTKEVFPHVPAEPVAFAQVQMATGDSQDEIEGLVIELPSGGRISAGRGASLPALRLALEVLGR